MRAVAFSPDGTRALTGSIDGTAVLWDATEGHEVRRYEGEGTHIVAAYSANGSQIVSGTAEGMAILRDSASGRIVQRFDGHPGPVTAVAIPVAPLDAGARDTIAYALDRSLAVEAGAGTGKTTALVERVVHLVISGTAVTRIAAI